MPVGHGRNLPAGEAELNFHINHPTNSSFCGRRKRRHGSLAVWPSHVSSVAELSPILNGKSGCTSCLLATACGLFLGLATHGRLGHRVYSYLVHKLSPIFADLSPILKEAKVVNLINRHKNNQLMMGMKK
jgi:hypothetical protein